MGTMATNTESIENYTLKEKRKHDFSRCGIESGVSGSNRHNFKSWVECSLRVGKFAPSNPGWVKSKTEKLAPVTSLDSVHHLRAKAGLVAPTASLSDCVWGFMLICGMVLRCVGSLNSRSDYHCRT